MALAGLFRAVTPFIIHNSEFSIRLLPMPDLKPLNDLVEAAIADGAFPGAAYAIGHAGQIHTNALGRYMYCPDSPAVQTDTLWDMASCSKVVGCTTARYGQGGSNIFRIAKGLIAKDILVLAGGCTSSVMEYTGLTRPQASEECGPGLKSVCQALGIPPVLSYGACVDIGKMTHTAVELADALGVDTDKLPLVIGAPEYLEQKAVADACTAIALGWLVHVAPVPSVTGSDVVVKTLTETTETLGLGKLMVGLSADKTVGIYVRHIEEKRKELGLSSGVVD
jgi:carbon-monoxide dehydrogenase catalytic subunit